MAEEWDQVNYERDTQNQARQDYLDVAVQRNEPRGRSHFRSPEQRSHHGGGRRGFRGQANYRGQNSRPNNYERQWSSNSTDSSQNWDKDSLISSSSDRSQAGDVRNQREPSDFNGQNVRPSNYDIQRNSHLDDSSQSWEEDSGISSCSGRSQAANFRNQEEPPDVNRQNSRQNNYEMQRASSSGNSYQNWNDSGGNNYSSGRSRAGNASSRNHGRFGHHQRGRNQPRGRGNSYTRNHYGEDYTGNKNTKGKKAMGFYKLKELLEKDPDDIMYTLKLEDSGFIPLLQTPDLSTDIIVMVLQLLARASESHQPRNLFAFMTAVSSATQFFNVTLPSSFLLDFTMSTSHCNEQNINAIFHLVQYLQAFSDQQPANSFKSVKLLLTPIKEAVNHLFSKDYPLNCEILELLENLETTNANNMTRCSDKNYDKMAQEERLQSIEPPDSFRSIPIYPTEHELMNTVPFLRPNIIDGKYIDAEHYLDIQFRLLREDSVRTLREGIADFRNTKNKKDLKGIKVYTDVQVLYPKCTINGVVHVISFDVKKLRYLRWDTSTRLLEGSLVCISKDDFQTMIFATVTKRDLEQLKDGLLYIRFEIYDEVVKTIRPHDKFVMVETSAFFEAYRHVLLALQDMHEHNFTFKKYIVYINPNIDAPLYLLENKKMFDIRPLMIEFPKQRVCKGGQDITEIVYSPVYDYVKNVHILNEKAWPPAHDMNLDESQLYALRSALTREFAIIQGPPGTGKTYIGLRIVQALLQNINSWGKGGYGTILIVCFTNHALDQFLEGVLYFTSKLVRVGSRCQSELLQEFGLNHLRQDYKDRKAFPRALLANKKENLRSLQIFEQKIKKVDLDITRACSDVITEKELKPFISEKHLKSLARGGESHPELHELHNDNKLILDWLGLRFRGRNSQAWFRDQTRQEDFSEDVSERKDEASAANPAYERSREFEASLDFCEDEAIEDSHFYADADSESASEGVMMMPEEDSDGETQHELDEYWELNGGEKARRNYLTRQLKQRTVMSEEQETMVSNVWSLTLRKRWELYRLWIAKYIMHHYVQISNLQACYQEQLNALAEVRHGCDLYILKNARVIGMTTTGAAKNKKLVQDLKPAILIVEEAAEVLEAHIVTCLTEDTQHVILIGDHQQLRPIPSVYMLAQKYNLDVSLFERLAHNGIPFAQLSIQHRMHPTISKLLVPHIYKVLSDHSDTRKYPEVKGVFKRLFFITHDYYEGSEWDSTSKVNTHEAKFLVKLCRYILNQGYKQSQVTILSAYSGQLHLIKKLMSTEGEKLEGVRATSVDNYQGEENDIVLVSFVRSSGDKGIGFLNTENRVNVALSRARMGLYCIGNFRYMAEVSPLWKNIVDDLQERDAIGPDLHLYCQNHPETRLEVRKDADFDSAPEGGCTILCDIRLPCGHKCLRLCHPYDKNHSEYKCMRPCQKIVCEHNHRCVKRCFQCFPNNCGECGFRVLKELKCGHEMKVPCSCNPSDAICKYPCTKMLPCDHACKEYCGEPCTKYCSVMVKTPSPCGHVFPVKCCKTTDKTYLFDNCLESCKATLSCGHKCSGKCSICFQGRLHKKCKNKCEKTLVCGHQCQDTYCAENCSPCQKVCANQCTHTKCPKPCGVPCDPCREPCTWICQHQKCTNLCGENCNRTMCNKPCQLKKLRCKHPCVGLCGELCPNLCASCDTKKLTRLFFGTEEEPGARFLMLSNCKHVFEVNGFFQWFETKAAEGIIQVPRCPQCQEIMTDTNGCLGDIIKSRFANVNLVKKKYFSLQGNKSNRQRDLKIHIRDLESSADSRFKPVINVLQSHLKNNLDDSRLVAVENLLNMIKQMDTAVEDIDKFHLGRLSMKIGKETLGSKLEDLLKLILGFIMQNWMYLSSQQTEDLSKEVRRFKLLALLIKRSSEADRKAPLNPNDHQRLTTCYFALLAPKPLQNDTIKNVKETIKFLSMTRAMAHLSITEQEKIVIIKAVGLKQGHWFKCPNGHVYCIGECGGATELSKCGDCGAAIGGVDHRLQEGNSLADEMDGAPFAAYSEEANNMYNYPDAFDDLE